MIGKRVQIPAWHDFWMMGDRFGEVVSVVNTMHPSPAIIEKYGYEKQYRVKLDKSGKVKRFFESDLKEVEYDF